MAAKDTNKILKFPQKKSILLHIKKSTAAKAEIKNHDYYIRDEYLKGFGITRCNSARGLQLKMNCCKR